MASNTTSKRIAHEIEHSKKLAKGDPNLIWGWSTPAGRLRAKRRAEFIASGAHLGPETRVLEIGCGTGVFTEMFAQTGAQLVAVDLSADLLEKARARALSADKVKFLEKSFEECDVEGPFDAVIGSSILHHLDIEVALTKIYDLLKPGGIMSFTEPNMLNPQIMLQKNIPWIKRRMGDSPDETAFVRWQLHNLLFKTGFERIEITPFDWLHPSMPRPLMRVVSIVGRWLETIPLIREFSGSLYIRCRRPFPSSRS